MELRPAWVALIGDTPVRRQVTVTITRDGQISAGLKVVEVLNGTRQTMMGFSATSGQPAPQFFDPAAIEGVWTFLATDLTNPVAMTAKRVTIPAGTDNVNIRFDITLNERPAGGGGRLSGTFPLGVTSIEGVPGPATIRVHYRAASGTPGDGMLMAEVQSNHAGVWEVTGLDPALKYDVVCRAPGYNDMILANVSPVPY